MEMAPTSVPSVNNGRRSSLISARSRKRSTGSAFPGVLLPTGQSCEDSWITAAGLAAHTERLKFLVALRPGVTSPVFAARQTAALDRLSNGRLLLNVVVGGNPVELAGDGVFLPHDERYEQAAEFLTIWRQLVSGETVNFEGKHYRVEGGRLDLLPAQESRRSIWRFIRCRDRSWLPSRLSSI